jgi:hypothetical protein
MRRLAVLLAMSGFPLVLHAQVPQLEPGADKSDTTQQMTAADSASFRARTTASKRPYHECTGHAFQTCASGETAARLSLDGTGYGIVLNIFDERTGVERSAFLWRITGRVGIGAGDDEGGGPGGGKGGKGRRGGRSKRGGG